MVIAIVSDAIYPYFKGGKEVRSYNLAIRLVKMGHEVHFYCMKWWDGPRDRIEGGIHLHAISKLYPMYKGERRTIKEGIMFGLSCFKLINKQFDVIDVDHMPFFPLYSVRIVCFLRRKSMNATWHEVWGRKYWIDYMGISGYFGYLLEKFSIYLPKKITSNSLHTDQRLHEILRYRGESNVVSAGIDFNKISKIHPADKKFDIIYAGRLLKHKNINLLIKAVAELRKSNKTISCLIIGEGLEKSNLVKLSKRLNVDRVITFKDFIDKQEDLYVLMKKSKVFVLPSSREGLGIVVIEANSCGIPVVTNNLDNNAAKDLIKHGYNGYIYKKNSVNLLSQGISEALESYKSLRKNCLKVASGYDLNLLSERLITQVYSE